MYRFHHFASLFILLSRLFLPAAPASADYKQAVAYYNRGQFDRAIQELKPDLDQNPDWEFGHRLVGLSYLSLRNNALAIASLTRAVQLKSTSFSTYFGLGQAYFNMQKYDSCIQALNQGEPFAKDLKEAEKYRLYHLRGSAYFRLEKFSEAINELTAGLRLSGGDWSDYSQLGMAYHQLKQYDEAIQALTKADSLKPKQGATAEFLGRAYFAKGIAALTAKQYTQALDFFNKAEANNPKDGYIYYNIAEAHIFQKNYVEAEKNLTQALAILPKSAEVFARLGLVYEKQKRWDLALNFYQKANEVSPSPALKEAIDRVTEAKKR